MWLEYIRYRFRLDKHSDLLELTQVAALKGLRNSPRCRGWRVLPAPDDPSLLVLEVEWDPGAELTPFRGSEEFATIHSALALQARSLEEADYRVDERLLRRVLGGPETLFRLAEDIVVGVLAEPALAWRFQSEDGSRRGRLGLWLLEVLGGPDLFSSSFPGSNTREGPLAHEWLDLEDRERLLEIAKNALPQSLEEQGLCVVGNLRAHLPLHPPPPSLLAPTPLLEAGVSEAAAPEAAVPEPGGVKKALASDVRHARQDNGPEAHADAPRAQNGHPVQTGVRPCLDEAAPAVRAAGHPWPHRARPTSPTPTLRGRTTGKWPRWRDRSR